MQKFLLLALAASVLLWGGCSEDDVNPLSPGPGGDVPASDLPFPGTPDQAIANFKAIYESLDAGEYELLLDPDFACHLQAETIAQFPALGATIDTGEEMRIHGRLFSGEEVIGPGGTPLPAIHGFSFSKLRQLIDWGESLSTDPIPNTLSALYAVEILVDRGPSFAGLKVDGQIRFYVKPAEGRVDGETRTYYRLVGQLDWTQVHKSTETIAWGGLKAMYF